MMIINLYQFRFLFLTLITAGFDTCYLDNFFCKTFFSELNNIENSRINILSNEFNSTGIVLKITMYKVDVNHLPSKMKQQNFFKNKFLNYNIKYYP